MKLPKQVAEPPPPWEMPIQGAWVGARVAIVKAMGDGTVFTEENPR